MANLGDQTDFLTGPFWAIQPCRPHCLPPHSNLLLFSFTHWIDGNGWLCWLYRDNFKVSPRQNRQALTFYLQPMRHLDDPLLQVDGARIVSRIWHGEVLDSQPRPSASVVVDKNSLVIQNFKVVSTYHLVFFSPSYHRVVCKIGANLS